MAVLVRTLASGSAGNATLVECGTTRVLLDAGLSCRALADRLEGIGVPPSSLTCIVLSHEHGDHARGAERLSCSFRVPVACSHETLEALELSWVHLGAWQPLEPGQPIEIGVVRLDAFPVPHDAARPVGFVLEGEGVRVGVVTDLGHVTTLVAERLRGCDVLVVEANHDDALLRDGPYPWSIKQRIGGRLGHLSNDEMAGLLRRVVDDRCPAVVLAHLSESNNAPALALRAARRALWLRPDIDVRVAHAHAPGAPVTL